jgi:NADH:ubiquinone oxidoreductase subunit 6 (subunit J)
MEFIDIFLIIAYILVIAATIGAVVLPLISAMSNPKNLVKSGIGVAGLLVLFLISWAVSGNEITTVYAKFNITETSSKVIGGVLITTYLLMFIAIVSIVYTEVNKMIK